MIIDFNAKNEQELMNKSEELSGFAEVASDGARSIVSENGPFQNAEAADDYCEVIAALGNCIGTRLANSWWSVYCVSNEFPWDGVDVYTNSTAYRTFSSFMDNLVDVGINSLTDPKGPFFDAVEANRMCDWMAKDMNNKACIPLANGKYIVYSVYENLPDGGIDTMDIFKCMLESEKSESK